MEAVMQYANSQILRPEHAITVTQVKALDEYGHDAKVNNVRLEVTANRLPVEEE